MQFQVTGQESGIETALIKVKDLYPDKMLGHPRTIISRSKCRESSWKIKKITASLEDYLEGYLYDYKKKNMVLRQLMFPKDLGLEDHL